MDHVGCWSGCFCGLFGFWKLECYEERCLSLSRQAKQGMRNRHILPSNFHVQVWLAGSKGESTLQTIPLIGYHTIKDQSKSPKPHLTNTSMFPNPTYQRNIMSSPQDSRGHSINKTKSLSRDFDLPYRPVLHTDLETRLWFVAIRSK
jgi:hypothetical protein